MEIHDFLGHGIEVERIDREIAPPRVFRLGAEHVVAQHAAVLVLFGGVRIGRPESGYFDRLRAQHHVHEAKTPADDEGAAKERFHLLRPRVRGDVEVLRLDAEEEIPHCAADDVTRESGLAQGRAHLRSRRADRIA